MLSQIICCLLWAVFFLSNAAVASEGDRSHIFQRCLKECVTENCKTDDNSTFKPSSIKPAYHIHLLWSCIDECKYGCMWQTVDFYDKYDWGVPQFYGKWPFVRFWGVQEPASVLFSLLNLVAHLSMLQTFRLNVPSTAPTYKLWHYHSAVCINAWLWSSVFHTRDYPLTEMMDYFCAFSMVLFSLYAMVMRLMVCKVNYLSVTFSLLCCALMIYHVAYLSLVKFDYGYNMAANILIGLLNGVSWLLWCYCQWRWHRCHYVWRCALSVVLALLAMSLEVLDFPPLMWTLDAHSLWHLSTSVLPFIWYRFLIDDCHYLMKTRKPDFKKLL